MNIYLYKNKVYRLQQPLDNENYKVSQDETMQFDCYVEINEDRAKELERKGKEQKLELSAEEIAIQEQRNYEERVVRKIRLKYTVDQELALLRQRDAKPAEFQTYNTYCEQCKQEVKEEIKIENVK